MIDLSAIFTGERAGPPFRGIRAPNNPTRRDNAAKGKDDA